MRRLGILFAATMLLAACAQQGGPVGAPPSGPSQPGSPAASSLPAKIVVKQSQATVRVPAGYDYPHLEFADLNHGYALFVTCADAERSRDCEALLFSTTDGGKSWKQRTHPHPVADNQQMYVVGPGSVLLLSEPHAWYVSHDGAATWSKRPYLRDELPEEYPMGLDAGPYFMDCGRDHTGPCQIRHDSDKQMTIEVPAELRQMGISLTNGPDGVIWLATLDANRQPITTVRGKGAADFRSVPVPKQEGRPLYNARVAVSPDGADVWLIAEQEPVTGGGGNNVLMRSALKATGLPQVWQLRDGGWMPRPITGIKERSDWPYTVAPVGGGLLVIAGHDETTGFLADTFVTVPGMPRLDAVWQRGGMVVGATNAPGLMYLSIDGRTWNEVRLSWG